MDITNKALMEEIVKRVVEKLAEMGQLEKMVNAAVKPEQNTAVVATLESKPTDNTSSEDNKEEVTYNRRLLSERDIIEHNRAGIKKIVYSKNTIVTDAAKDHAKQIKIELIRQS